MSHFPIPSVSESSQFFTAEQEATHQTSPEAPVGLEIRSPGSRPVAVEEDDVMESWQGEVKWGCYQIPAIGLRQQVQARMSGVLGLEKGPCPQPCQFPETHTMT